MRLLPLDSFKRSILYGAAVSSALSGILTLYFLYIFVVMLAGDDLDSQGGLIVVVGPMVVAFVFTVFAIVFTAVCEAYRSVKNRKQSKYWTLHFSISVFIVLIPILFILALYSR